MPYRYVPLLKSKSGEATALQNLSAHARQRIFPVIHLVQSPPATLVQGLARAWAGHSLAIDGLFNSNLSNSTATFTTTITGLRQQQIPTVPCVEYGSPPPYVSAAQRFITRHQPSVVVKVNLRHLPQISAWVAANNWQAANVDLIVTAGHAALYDPQQFEGFVLHALQTHLPNPNIWASVTLASSAAPRDTGALAVGRNVIPRLDWRLWNAVHSQVVGDLDYGDYATSFPELTEPPGIAMTRATVSVRYTVDDDWLIFKGAPTTGARGQPMGAQYRAHARALLREPQFNNVANCWADDRIRTIAALPAGPGTGSRATWAGLAVNRHLSLVAQQLP
jgi:hypothetical protein